MLGSTHSPIEIRTASQAMVISIGFTFRSGEGAT
jgi:hypothetical protein